MPRRDPRFRDRWDQDLIEDPDARDLRKQRGQLDLDRDPGARDVTEDRGKRELDKLVKERVAPFDLPGSASISGGFTLPPNARKRQRARRLRKATE
jgi:hypothetical protein